MTYFEIGKKYPDILSYGALHYFFSCLGQTFLISVSVPFLIEDLKLTSSEFSNGYAVATICSALTLPLIGSWVDHSSYRKVSLIGGLGLILACLVMYESHTIWTLIPGLYLLRFFGQGGMILIGSTIVAKFFDKNRGKSLSLASIGLAVAETFMPVVIVYVITDHDWRASWLLLATAVLVIFLPLTQGLIRRHERSAVANEADTSGKTTTADFTRRQVLKDPKFYLVLPAFIFLPFFITGMFIHQNLLAIHKGWSLEWMATCFIGFGIAKVAMSFFGGALIDRFSGKQVFIFYLLPLALGLFVLLLGQHKLLALIYMFLLGMTASLGSLSGVAIWAELYGVKNLGAIKSMTTTFMVISTALGPIVLGYSIQRSLNLTLIFSIATILIIIIASWWVIGKKMFR